MSVCLYNGGVRLMSVYSYLGDASLMSVLLDCGEVLFDGFVLMHKMDVLGWLVSARS